MTHWIKFSRANDHLATIDAVISRFLDMKPYRLVREYDPQPPFEVNRKYVRCVVRLSAPLTPPAELALLVGDCLSNFRASLDHLVYAIALKYTRRTEIVEQKFLQFPIYDDGKKFGDWRGRVVKANLLSADVLRDLETCQPYQGWDGKKGTLERHLAQKSMWVLNALINADKHRTITPVTQIRISNLRFGATIPGEGALAGFTMTGTFKDGDQIGPAFNFQPDTANAEVSLNADTEPDVAFGDEWPARGRPVGKLLHEFQERIRDDIFAHFEMYLK